MNKMRIAGIVMVAIALAGCAQVDQGFVGVKVNQMTGSVQALGPGTSIYNPLLSDVEYIDTRTIKWEGETQAYTRDIQQANIRFALNYNINPKAVVKTYQTVGTDWADRLLPQIVIQSIKDVIGQSEAVKDTINNRGLVQSRIQAEITKKLASKNIVVTGFQLNDVAFSKAFEEAVEQKQIAVENANAERNKTVAVEERSRQAIITAKGEAEAMRIKTEALAGSPKLVEYESVQKWNGVLPTMMMGNGTPFINVNSK